MENNKCLACGLDINNGVYGHVHAVGRPELDPRTSQLQTPQPDIVTHTFGRNKGGRPKGFDGTRSRMPSALAQKFRACGLDWQADFADAIKRNRKERIKLWLRLLPYMITTSKRAKVKRWTGKPSKAARIALDAMEQEL